MFKISSPIFKAFFLVSFIGVLSRILGFGREVVFASKFGITPEFDLYLVSIIIPFTINTISLYISQNYIIPEYNRIKKNSPENSIFFVRDTFGLFTIASVIISLILFSLGKPIFHNFFFTNRNIETAIHIYSLGLITIPLNVGYAVLAAYHQAEFNFKNPAIAQLNLNAGVIITVIIGSNYLGVYSIVIGYILGSIMQLGMVLKPFKNSQLFTGKVSFNFLKGSLDPILLMIIFIESVSQFFMISDRFLYQNVDSGGIAALNYSYNIFSLPLTVFIMAISTVALPLFAKWVNTESSYDFKSKYSQMFRNIILFFTPIFFVFFLQGDLIVKVLYERGKFGTYATSITYELLKIFSLSLIVLSLYSVMNKLLYSLKYIKQLLIITVTGISMKIILNIILVHTYQQNGLALSTTITYIFFFTSCYLFLIKKKVLKLQLLGSALIYFLDGALCWAIAEIVFIANANLVISLAKILLFLLLYSITFFIIEEKTCSKNLIRILRFAKNPV